MALSNQDLFIVQDSIDKQHYKLSLEDLKANLEISDSTNFKGLADLSQAPADQGITAPANGDMYIVETTTASIDAGWTIAGSPTEATAGDQILWYEDGSTWYLFTPEGGGGSAGVVAVSGVAPIQVGGSASNPEVSIDPALKSDQTSRPGNSTSGSVKGLATAADVAETVVGGDAELVVTADLLVATNSRIKVIEDNGGGGGGIVGDYVKTLVEGADTVNNLTGVLTLTNTDGDYTIQVKKEQFAPYDFSALTDITV